MSLQFTHKPTPDSTKYFIYLKTGKIVKSMFTEHPYLSLLLLFLAYQQLKKADFNWGAIKQLGGKLLQIHKRINALVVEFKTVLTPQQLEWLKNYLHVDIEQVKTVTAYNDVAVTQTGVSEVWEHEGLTGKGVTVAVLDTGINPNHTNLKSSILQRRDFTISDTVNATNWFSDFLSSLFDFFKKTPPDTRLDPVGHGTHVAGTIAGNGPSFSGVAPEAKILDVRVLDSNGSGSTDQIIKGMSWAAKAGADIISMSLGGPGNADDVMSREANALAKEGIIVVVAAGNSGPGYNTIGSPGTAEHVITVGAVDPKNQLTNYSSRGPVTNSRGQDLNKPDILAPGGGIQAKNGCTYGDGITSVKSEDTATDRCTIRDTNGDAFQKMSGTSMATPHVAGACALLLQEMRESQIFPVFVSSYVKDVLKQTAKDLNYKKDQQGAGLLNLTAAIEHIQ